MPEWENLAKSVASQILLGLGYLHFHKILHNNLKLSNVAVAMQGGCGNLYISIINIIKNWIFISIYYSL